MFLTFINFLVFNILFENRQFLCWSGVRKKTISDARPTIWLIMSWWCRDVDQWVFWQAKKWNDLRWPQMTVTLNDLVLFSKREFRCSFAILTGATLKNKTLLHGQLDRIGALRTLTVQVINDGTYNKDCYDEGQNCEHDVMSSTVWVFQFIHFCYESYESYRMIWLIICDAFLTTNESYGQVSLNM